MALEEHHLPLETRSEESREEGGPEGRLQGSPQLQSGPAACWY